RAQRRRTRGAINNPLSSISSRYAPLRRAFLDARPVRFQPLGDGLVVALAGAAPRLLRCEVALAKPGRQIVRVELDSPLVLDEPGQIGSRPQLSGTAVLGGVVVQPTADNLPLGGGRFGWPTGHRPGREAAETLSTEGGDPAADTAGMHLEEVGDFFNGV